MFRKFGILLIGLKLAFGTSQVLAADSVVLSQARLGNLFLSNEQVQIPVQTTGDQVTWTVKDYYGATTTGAVVSVPGNGSVTITPGAGRLGFFELRVTALRNGSAVASADTTFAVVAPSNVSAMPDSAFGVMTHFAQSWNTEIMQILARAGVVHFRDEQYWQNVEPTRTTPATYTFTRYEPYMALAASLGLKPHMVLDFANSNYDAGNSPYTDDGRAGYANYSKALLARYGSQIDSVAIWNEYSGSFSKGPATANRPLYYYEMLKTAYTAIKAARPDVRVIGGACVPMPLPWFEDIFARGALDYLDVLDIHPYRSIPEGVEVEIAALQSLAASYNRSKPIWATECGAPDTVNPGRQNMSAYLVRLMTLMRTAGVERAYWYLAYDYDGYSTGLMRSPNDPLGRYAPSSALPAYSNLIQQLYGASHVRRENTDARTRFYLFRRGSDDVRVAWSTVGTAQLVLTTNSPLTLINIMGESTVLQPTGGAIALTVDSTPSFLVGSVSAIREVSRDVIVADSVRDFSGTPGSSNGTWSYANVYIDNGVYVPVDPVRMTSMNYNRTSYGYEYNSYFAYAKLDLNGGHPSARFGYPVVYPVWMVRRWLSNSAANARFTGTLIRSNPFGDGTGARIYVNGNLAYSTLVGGAGFGATVNFDFTAPIQVGSKVDFILTPGPGINIDYDYVDFQAQISVPASPPSTFAAWQDQNFTAAEIINPAISGDTAAPAGDGVHNLLKYSANLGPKAFSASALPLVRLQSVATDTYLTLSYRRAGAASDLTFIPELNAGDLSANPWTPGGVQLGPPVNNGDGTQTFTIRDVVPIGPAIKSRYMRLRVTRP